jgi:hypothetical protein
MAVTWKKLAYSADVLALGGNGSSQYQTIITGASPFAPVYSGFLLDGTTGGKTIFSVSNTKVLTILTTNTYTLTIAGTASISGTNTGDVTLGGVGTDGLSLTNQVLTLGTPSACSVSTSSTLSGHSHTHAITASSNPGAAASILATDVGGQLTCVTLYGSTVVEGGCVTSFSYVYATTYMNALMPYQRNGTDCYLYHPIAVTTLNDTVPNTWGGSMTAVTSTTYNFDLSVVLGWDTTVVKAWIILIQGVNATAGATATLSVCARGTTNTQVKLQSVVNGAIVVATSIVFCDANGDICVIVGAGANWTSCVLHVQGYFM